jgi:CheY-like chemotaxis protein
MLKKPSSEHQEKQKSGKKVLIVDDHADALESLAILLTLRGYAVCSAMDGHAALRLATETRPDVVLLDIGLPGISGYDVATRLRSSPETRNVFLIAVSGYDGDQDKAQATAAGFDAYLVKPLEIEELIQYIAKSGATTSVTESDTANLNVESVQSFVPTTAVAPLPIATAVVPTATRSAQAVLVHELSQPLTALHSYLEGAKRSFCRDTAANQDLERFFDDTRRLTLRLQQTLQVLRDEDLWTAQPSCRINCLLRSVLTLSEARPSADQAVLAVELDQNELHLSQALSSLVFALLVELLGSCRSIAGRIDIYTVTSDSGTVRLHVRVDASGAGITAADVVRSRSAMWMPRYSGELATLQAQIEVRTVGQGIALCTLVLPIDYRPKGTDHGTATHSIHC